MAKRAMMFCPRCAMVGQKTSELFTEMPEVDVFRCLNSHSFPNYLELMKLEPEMIKVVADERLRQVGDVKLDNTFVDGQVLAKFDEMCPGKRSATIESILRLYILGAPIIIDGVQAKKLNALGVRTGAEMLAAIEVGKTLEAELNTAQEKVAMMQSLFQGAGVQVPG